MLAIAAIATLAATGTASAAANGRIFLTAPGCSVASVRAAGGGFDCVFRAGRNPSVSPNGRLIAWNVGAEPNDVWIMNVNGTRARQVTRSARGTLGSLEADFSPDSRRIAYAQYGGDAPGIYLSALDGSGRRRVAEGGGHPSFAPDGRAIAFTRDGIATVDANGGNERVVLADRTQRGTADGQNLDTVVERNREPRFSPDGRRIVFSREVTSTRFACNPFPNCRREQSRDVDVYVMNANGGDVRRLTSDAAAEETDPAFSPDGRRIVYFHWPLGARSPEASLEEEGFVHVMDADGRRQRRLLRGSNPFWSAVRGGPQRPRVAVAGLPRGCARGRFAVRVRIVTTASRRTFVDTRVLLDGRRVSRTGDDGARRFEVFVSGRLRPGIHRLTIVALVGLDRVTRVVRFRAC